MVHSWEQGQGVVQKYLVDKYVAGMKAEDVQTVDLTGGATGIAGFIQKMVLAAYSDFLNKEIVDIDKDIEISSKIYELMDLEKSEAITEGLTNEAVIKKIVAKDKDGNVIGHLYKVSGEHKRGSLVLLVAIDSDNKLVGLEIVENGQTSSWPAKVEGHIVENYVPGISEADVNEIDALSGATLGSDLAKKLVLAAFNEHTGGAQ